MATNVLGTELEICSRDPLTGFFRNGKCETCGEDVGMHTVCAEMTEEFLAYTRAQGNDLTTPHPQFHFPGLQPGDRWCICLSRWVEAYEAGCAPRINLRATHISALEHVKLETLQRFAAPDDDKDIADDA